MVYEKITENVYAITDGSTRGNVAALELPNQIVFVDTGMHIPLMKEFREKLEKETGKKTTALLITHPHGDHVFGNQIFEDCKIIASKNTYEQMVESKEKQWTPENIKEWEKNAEDPSSLKGLKIVIANEQFDKEYTIKDDEVKVIAKETGGHTSGSSYVYCPQYKVLIAGDNLFVNNFPWGGPDSADPIQWKEALEEYLSLNVEYFIPGHGPVADKKKIKEFLEYLNKVIELMKSMIQQGKSEEITLKAADKIKYYPPRREQWKEATLKKWYEVISEKYI